MILLVYPDQLLDLCQLSWDSLPIVTLFTTLEISDVC